MDHAIDAVIEIFTWVGLGAGILLGLVALILKLADGTWLQTRAIVEHGETGSLVRWFDADGGVNAAALNHEQAHALAGKEMADIFYRRGRPPGAGLHRPRHVLGPALRARLTHRRPSGWRDAASRPPGGSAPDQASADRISREPAWRPPQARARGRSTGRVRCAPAARELRAGSSPRGTSP